MGIDYDGGMIVGELGHKLETPSGFKGDLSEWVEEVELERMSKFYDADIEYNVIGFRVSDVKVSDIEGEWLIKVKKLAKKFEALTGVPARLIGTQDIW